MKKFAFTKRSIEALPAHDPDSPSREAEYSDSECIGLKLRVSKGGRKFFQHRYRHLGRKRCLTIGEFPHVSIQDARKRVSEHKGMLSRDIDPASEREQKRQDIDLASFCTDFYIPHAMSHKRTWQNDQYMLNHRVIPVLGKLHLRTITLRDLSTFHAKEKERVSATTANHYLILLKRMLNLAVKWGLLEKSPASGLEKFKQDPPRERYLSKEELPRFLKALDEQEDRLSMAAIKLLLFTGCRKGEILSLRWDQVRLEENRLFLPITKNGNSRSVLLNANAKAVLETLHEEKDDGAEYVFPSRSGSRKPHLGDLRKPFARVCAAAKIDDLRIHDLRHSFATLAVMSGASLYDIQKLLGHSDISMTQRYAHMVDDNLKRATDNVSDVINQAISA
jgi:integrase